MNKHLLMHIAGYLTEKQWVAAIKSANGHQFSKKEIVSLARQSEEYFAYSIGDKFDKQAGKD